MSNNRLQSFQAMNTRQKVTVIAFIVVLLIIIWQVWGLFGSSSTTPPPATAAAKPPMNGMPNGTASVTPPPAPQIPAAPAAATKSTALNDAEILKLQQETQTKYLQAINELQMLKVQREIAETNQAIAKAKLDTVTAQKNILDLFAKPVVATVPASAYSASLVTPTPSGTPTATGLTPPPTPQPTAQPEGAPSYIVLSVSFLLDKWSAVIGYQGKLFNVSVGDVLPVDGSMVVAIDKSGVVLSKDNVKRKVSLVSVV